MYTDVFYYFPISGIKQLVTVTIEWEGSFVYFHKIWADIKGALFYLTLWRITDESVVKDYTEVFARTGNQTKTQCVIR